MLVFVALRHPFQNAAFASGFVSRVPCVGEFVRADNKRWEVQVVDHCIMAFEPVHAPGAWLTVAETQEPGVPQDEKDHPPGSQIS